MTKNVARIEQVIRVILAIAFGLLACLISSWPGWVRIGSGIIAIAFLATALVGY